jgi:hypothetical protein
MTVTPRNCNRAYAAQGQSLAADFTSQVIDFHEMPMGSIQAVWRGASGAPLDGTFRIYVSNLPELETFDPEGCLVAGAEFTVHNATGSRIWIRERIGFRYALVRYTAGNMSDGVVDLVAIAKRS